MTAIFRIPLLYYEQPPVRKLKTKKALKGPSFDSSIGDTLPKQIPLVLYCLNHDVDCIGETVGALFVLRLFVVPDKRVSCVHFASSLSFGRIISRERTLLPREKFQEKEAEQSALQESNKAVVLSKPEIIVALIAKIGTDVGRVSEVIKEELGEYGYDTHLIRVSGLLEHPKVRKLNLTEVKKAPFHEYCNSAMNACNELRAKTSNDIMAKLAVAAVRQQRTALQKDHATKDRPRAFVIRQLKRKEEVDFLRALYGEKLVLISAYCPVSVRKSDLAKQIARTRRSTSAKDFYAEAEALIKRDEDESGNDAGQNVRDVFPLADVILNAKTSQDISYTVRRFLRAFFGDPLASPSKDEHGSFMAYAASMRSIDLSRKVGAAIFSPRLEVLSMGANEVPKHGGGTYLGDEVDSAAVDGRDAALGYDANAQMKNTIAEDATVKAYDFIKEVLNLEDAHDDAFHSALASGVISEHKHLKNMLVLDIGEFGRAVHAEMNAITDAARSNHSVQGATLYCTTFPCHNCAKHIVASGISRVVYLQPYPKSRVEELYPDSIVINPMNDVKGKVIFEVITGIAPNIYERIYNHNRKRKDKAGKAVAWSKRDAQPLVSAARSSHVLDEKVAVRAMNVDLDQAEISN